MKQRFWLSLRGRALGHVLLSPMGLLGRFEAFELIIPLDAFTRESDQEVCADALIKRLEPHKVLDSLQSSPHQGTPSFTRLWLDEAQSFRRKSIEPLDTGVELQGGRYRILERVATGGQATVYRAIETTTSPERTVVLKEFVLPVGAGVSVRSRSFDSVKNEALLLSSLKDPGIIEIYDNFVEDHRAYLVLENISGITLRHLVLSEGPLDEKEARSVAVQVSNVLRYLHGRTPPVVHRDLTPDNLIRTPEGNIKLLDFNVALQSESNTTKTVVGKHNYIPPEQFRGMPSPQSDLYSLGATLFFLLTGKDPDALCQSSLEKAGVNSMLESVVSKLTEQELTARYQSVDAVLDDLNALSA